MTINNKQMFSLVMGSIPGFNIPVSIGKFLYYLGEEKSIADRIAVEQTATKINETAKNSLQNLKKEVSNLKWYALIQIIPFVGIYFACVKEKSLLERINAAASNLNATRDIDASEEIKEGQVEDSKSKGNILELANENFDDTIAKGTTAVLFHINAAWGSKLDAHTGEAFELTSKKMAGVTFGRRDLQNIYSEELYTLTNPPPYILLFKEGKCIGNGKEEKLYTANQIEEFIQSHINKENASLPPSTETVHDI